MSISIVNWNTCELLKNCIESIYKETSNIQFEIILIDNASSDDSVEMVKSDFPGIILIENSRNRGFAAANNQGIRISTGRYVLLLNSDTIVCDNAIEETVQYADKHPEAAVVGCQVWESADTIQMTCFRFPSVANLFLSSFGLATVFKRNRILGREWMLWWKRDSEREIDLVSGMFMLVRREAIEQVGILDERFFMYCEEVDWCYRFRKAGWRILFWPGAKIIHVAGGSCSSNQVMLKMFVQKQKSLLIFLKKHRSRLSYWLGRLILVFSFSLRVVVCAISLLLKKMARKNARRESAAIQRNWTTFKFCALGLEPK